MDTYKVTIELEDGKCYPSMHTCLDKAEAILTAVRDLSSDYRDHIDSIVCYSIDSQFMWSSIV